MKSYERAKQYAKQRGISELGSRGWGFKPTPRQRRRLERIHMADLRALLREVKKWQDTSC